MVTVLWLIIKLTLQPMPTIFSPKSVCPKEADVSQQCDQFYRRYQPLVYRQCRALLDDPEDAFDVAQEAMLKAMRKIDSFRGQAKLTTWLHAIAHNECLLFLRRQRRQCTRTGSFLAGCEVAEEPTDTDAHLRINRQEMMLPDLLRQLSEEDQQLLRMKYWEGASINTLQHTFHLPSPSSVKMRLHRARRKLQQLYRQAEC